MNRYLVTGPRPVLDHAPGEEFEAELVPEQEAEMLATGRLAIVPRTYQVVGPLKVHDTDPGGTFTAAFTVLEEQALLDAGHIERADVPAPKSRAKNPGKE